ncbi:RHS repeat-associated core domain-containing protein, partial [Aeromonas sp. ANP5]|uniref:RHS repeat-associated core domain-containing protein n=1 Tax=Aeromonas sp. ANP5 TaxID=1535538 RepID=UPI000ACAC1A7
LVDHYSQVVAERSKRGHERQARLFGYDSELNLCELSNILPSDGQPLSSQQAQAEPLRRYDAAGRVSQIGQNQYRYDKCGRLSEKVVSRPGFRPQTTQFEWDGFDRLQRVILPDGSRWRYRYDPFGRRIGKEREGQVSQLTAITRVHYRWDGDQLVQQQSYRADGNAARQVQWVYEPGSFRPLAQWEASEQDEHLHYIVTDVAGTARELCSEAGDIIWRGEQRLWGNYRADAIPQPLRRFLGDAANDETYCELRYQGQIYDQETGLYYNRHRYFDPELGQYISSDPIGFAGGLRPQGYVHNPLEWVDPLGFKGFFTRTVFHAPSGSTHTVYQQAIDWDLPVNTRSGVKTNLDIALDGGSPFVVKNGKYSQINLHHSKQDGLGSLFELSADTHQRYYKSNALHPHLPDAHPNNPVDRSSFNVDRDAYWRERANGELAKRNKIASKKC